ncbi:threonine aldolase family protein [Algihabitans albus]|uniref:threonine aldolase family protein n=1 Tax=Algihabitans albus TaxID=2164067 RepID=UPI000E5D8627|nr:low specificity L-threonine aldolase [Algihabitans albus]
MNFASDNVTGACPEVLDALVAANDGAAMSYGEDPWTARVQMRLRELFGKPDLLAFPVATGTAANALALATLVPPYGAIYCHRDAHINLDECGAPELYTGGAKLVTLAGEGAKIAPDSLAEAAQGHGVVHHVQPAAVSITQATEAGCLYSPEEVAAIAETARSKQLKLHMDGARFANAVAALDLPPAEITWKAGVDVLSFGATKNGCLAAEAVVFFRPELAESFRFHRKRAGHLFSKGRVISAQLEAYLKDRLWLENARHANGMARRLGAGLAALPGCRLLVPVEANEVFTELPPEIVASLTAAGVHFIDGYFGPGVQRFVCAWNTRIEDVEAVVAAAKTTAGALRSSAEVAGA